MAELKTCVVLPTYNEEESIAQMINAIRKLNLPLFVMDEHSRDKTEEIAKSLGVEVYQREGSGKGAGLISAINLAGQKGFDIIVIIDCDSSYPVEDIPKLLEYIPEYDMVIGSRNLNDVEFSHRIGNIIHTQAINILFNSRLKDINSGMRAIKVKRMSGLLNANGFDIEAQITIKAIKNKFKIKEIPIKYKERLGQSKIRIKDGFLILSRIIKERLSR